MSTAAAGPAKLDALLRVMLNKGLTPANAHKTMPGKLVGLRTGTVNGKAEVLVDVLLQADLSALGQIKGAGAKVRTVTSSGIMTASVPLSQVQALAAITGVKRIEAAKRKQMYMDKSRGPTGLNIPGTYPGIAPTGKGVIVGVIDTGLDWSHKDFRKADGTTRVLALWDQSDLNDKNPPDAAKDYGTVYERATIDSCIQLKRRVYCAQKDTNGHGTHVTGTAAGNGLAYDGTYSAQHQFRGVAPEADILFVKFDFDGDRNSSTAIVDGVDWIFTRAAALGRPCVINMSLGSDYGPHDATSSEEQGIDDLTGPGKIVVVAAGNPGRNNDSPNVGLWGYALHGQGKIPSTAGACSEITLDLKRDTTKTADDHHAFVDAWYPGGTSVSVTVTTPSGATYTNVAPTGSEWSMNIVGDGWVDISNVSGASSFWGAENGDNNLYFQITPWLLMPYLYYPRDGVWSFKICAITPCAQGTDCPYHGWYGVSEDYTLTVPKFEGKATDNAMTVGNPATAQNVIAVAAYVTRKGPWDYYNPSTNTYGTQSYGVAPIQYYDPFDEGDLVFFSAYGPLRKGTLQKPEIAAPGVGIIASLSQAKLAEELTLPVADTYLIRTNRVYADKLHSVLQGTSMACPHATGAVALLLAQNATLTPAEVRARLAATARTAPTAADPAPFNYYCSPSISSECTASSFPNVVWGHGKLDVTAALDCSSGSLACNDGNVCTADTCSSGKCVFTTLAENATCGTKAVCCSGACKTVCTSSADCNGRTCLNPGTCAAKCDCLSAGATCSLGTQCCSGVCSGKKVKTCQ